MNIQKLETVGLDIADNLKEGKVVIDVFTTWCGPCTC